MPGAWLSLTALSPQLGSKWSSSWAVAPLAIVGPGLCNFVPIDLDEWWAQQFLARITNCS